MELDQIDFRRVHAVVGCVAVKKIAICKDCRGTGCRDRDKLWVRV